MTVKIKIDTIKIEDMKEDKICGEFVYFQKRPAIHEESVGSWVQINTDKFPHVDFSKPWAVDEFACEFAEMSKFRVFQFNGRLQ